MFCGGESACENSEGTRNSLEKKPSVILIVYHLPSSEMTAALCPDCTVIGLWDCCGCEVNSNLYPLTA